MFVTGEFMKLTRLFFTVATAGLLVVSCAKDRDLKDYQEDERTKDRAKLAAVSGDYSGYFISKQSQASVNPHPSTLLRHIPRIVSRQRAVMRRSARPSYLNNL